MRSGGGSRQRRVGGAHLGGVRDSVNGFLRFSFKNFAFLAEPLKSLYFLNARLAGGARPPWGSAPPKTLIWVIEAGDSPDSELGDRGIAA